MAVGQWEISGLENVEAGNWESLEGMAGKLMPILMSIAPLCAGARLASGSPDRIPVVLVITSCDIISCLWSGANLLALHSSVWMSSIESTSDMSVG